MDSVEKYLESISFDITTMDLCYIILTEIPNLSRFIKLTNLYINNTQLIELKNLPNTLKILSCDNNQLTELKNLPNTLEYLYCNNNQLIELNNLPNTLHP
jgi:hypothetical protein